jgi:hypothetical protein
MVPADETDDAEDESSPVAAVGQVVPALNWSSSSSSSCSSSSSSSTSGGAGSGNGGSAGRAARRERAKERAKSLIVSRELIFKGDEEREWSEAEDRIEGVFEEV